MTNVENDLGLVYPYAKEFVITLVCVCVWYFKAYLYLHYLATQCVIYGKCKEV